MPRDSLSFKDVWREIALCHRKEWSIFMSDFIPTWCKCGATKKKNPLRTVSERVSSTQSRGRTGTGRPTGV